MSFYPHPQNTCMFSFVSRTRQWIVVKTVLHSEEETLSLILVCWWPQAPAVFPGLSFPFSEGWRGRLAGLSGLA